VETLSDADFDLAISKSLRAGEGEGHAMAYVHRHVMDASAPVPIVPVFLNTYSPPNQPSPRRCYRLGEAVRRVVESFRNKLQAGSSEILNWMAVAGAAEGIDLNWFEYVPSYRTRRDRDELCDVGVRRLRAHSHRCWRLIMIAAGAQPRT
jgi:3-O-methylgallate 3,4-dioxygenase